MEYITEQHCVKHFVRNWETRAVIAEVFDRCLGERCDVDADDLYAQHGRQMMGYEAVATAYV
jgi:hypothetical protein